MGTGRFNSRVSENEGSGVRKASKPISKVRSLVGQVG